MKKIGVQEKREKERERIGWHARSEKVRWKTMKEKERMYACMCERVKGVRERDKRRTAPYWLSGSFVACQAIFLSFSLTFLIQFTSRRSFAYRMEASDRSQMVFRYVQRQAVFVPELSRHLSLSDRRTCFPLHDGERRISGGVTTTLEPLRWPRI